MFSAADIATFQRDGFIVVSAFLSADETAAWRHEAEHMLAQRQPPFELEAEVGYPGAPDAKAPGGDTIRRLKQLHDRDSRLASLPRLPGVVARLEQLVAPPVALVTGHHNCLMTKQPAYSSQTGWHRDVRYWSFNNTELVNIWLALGRETIDNGAMRIIPGSHRQDLPDDAFDDLQFLLPNHPAGAAAIAQARYVELQPGDLLFFHARCLHAAGANHTERTKFSLVYTHHGVGTRPLRDQSSTDKH